MSGWAVELKPRMWRSLDTCIEYLTNELHIARRDSLDAAHHTDARAEVPGVSRPDSAKRMRDAFEASAHTKWLEAKVADSRAGMADGSNRRIDAKEWALIRAAKQKQRITL